MFRIIILLFTLSLAFAGKIKFEDCGHGEISEIRSPECEVAECEFLTLHKGKEYTVDTEGIFNQDTQRIHIELFAKIGGVEVQIPESVSNGCIGLGITCPVKKGQKFHIHSKGTVPLWAPTLTSYAKYVAYGDHGLLGCAIFRGEITD